ncbi:MAG: S8 family serine peptidase [Pyrinomonadaceae bacterium]|nr:S8 family serine peptidase [Pyrinomonadaceae bacterium]
MYSFRYGGKNGKRHSLTTSDEHVVVRTNSRSALADPTPVGVSALSTKARAVLGEFELTTRFREAGVEILRTKVVRGSKSLRDKARAILKKEPEIEFAGRVLVTQQSAEPVLYTENFFVKFDSDQSATACRKILKSYKLTIKSELEYARNAYFVGAPEDTGLVVFDIAEKLLQEPSVEFCHPELIRESRQRSAFPQQWHLKRTTINGNSVDAHASVEAAWALSEGQGATIAVIDDGVDMDHQEFQSAGKVIAPRDVTRKSNNPRPGNGDNHGTACAGVACANGTFGASGVAPKARLIPIRLASVLGSQAEADAFVWAAQNGADVISCSWGPPDGDWWDPTDPVHNQSVPLPDSTRLAIDFATTQGRNGKGCIILFAAGNGNESVDNDGYASYSKVTAVAACNDKGKKSEYSDFGGAVWCAFPSNHGNPSLTPGIWTTDRTGSLGYNSGNALKGDAAGNFTNSFGGTSSSCPGAAGVAALIIARNPSLRWDQVRDIIKQSCDKIDPAGGNYDANGRSPIYGYGRINAKRAVELALPPQPDPISIQKAIQDVPIKDLTTSKLDLAVADTKPLKSIRVSVDIEHTYIGDLIVSIKPPASTGVSAIKLHNREGGALDNIKKTYDSVNAPGLVALTGKSPQGTWTLIVEDKEKQDTGRIRSFTLEMKF